MVGFEIRSASHDSRAEEFLAELKELASTAGAQVVASISQSRQKADAATLFGRGKVDEIKALAESMRADLVVVDFDLSPTQQRNLEKLLDTKVIDRTQLILDIFASRARTREGRLQVELAQLNYLLPRLSGHGVSMSRLGGGIGTRGPGETKLETDRRRIQGRIKKIEDNIEKVRAGRSLHRQQRQAVPLATIALVGYTNAGKSTLFNRLAQANVLADKKMFATLDPTVRAVQLPSRRRVLLSDTVGFIRNLPTSLIRAFRATLEEVADAALILHVVDVSSDQAAAQTAQVFRVLNEIGASGTPQILVLNKSDQLAVQPDQTAIDESALTRAVLKESPSVDHRSVLISGLTGSGIAELLRYVDEALPQEALAFEHYRIPAAEGAEIARLHAEGRVLSVEYDGDVCDVEAAVPATLSRRLERFAVGVAGSVENSVRNSPW